MSLNQKVDFTGKIAKTIELAEEAKGPKEMISVLANERIEEFLTEKKAQKVKIATQNSNNNTRPDFSDLLDL